MKTHNSETAKIHIHGAAPVSIFAYWPIVAVYAVSAAAALFSIKWHPHPDYMSHGMGFVLVLFGLIKLSDLAGFAKGFAQYDPLARKSVLYAQTYPFIEILLGTLFVLQLFILPATLLTLFIYSVSFWGAVGALFKKESLHCVCLGTYFKLPLSKVALIEAGFMIGMCLWMLGMLGSMTNMTM